MALTLKVLKSPRNDNSWLIDFSGFKSKKNYKVYTAIINQTGTNDPVPIVLENTLGWPIIWTRNSIGEYYGSNYGAFVFEKTFCLTGNTREYAILIAPEDEDTMILAKSDSAGNPIDFVSNLFVEIRVYN